jgi:hypothetical protein
VLHEVATQARVERLQNPGTPTMPCGFAQSVLARQPRVRAHFVAHVPPQSTSVSVPSKRAFEH